MHMTETEVQPPATNTPEQRVGNALVFVATAFGAAACVFGFEAGSAVGNVTQMVVTASAGVGLLPMASLSGLVAMNHITAS